MDFQIISDSSCDLDMELREKYNIQVVPFYISFDGEKYYKEREEIDIREVYQRMVDEPKNYPMTSLPSVQNYIDAFTPHVEAGRAIICMCLTTSLSGSYNSACNAMEIICEEHPDAKITVINSLSATVSQGVAIIEAARMQQEGKSYEEVVAYLNGESKSTSRIFFTVGNTDYLKHGGRIGKVAAVASSVLSLKPLITLKDGEINASSVARSRKKSLVMTLDLVRNYFKETGDNPKDYIYAVGFGYDKDEAVEFKKQFEDMMNNEFGGVGETLLFQIGATICVHTGPYAIGVGLIKKHDCI